MHHVFVVGSKDETVGNQLCQLRETNDDTYSLKIRVSDRMPSPGEDKWLLIDNLTFSFDREARDAGTTLSRRLYCDERGWRAFVSVNHMREEMTTASCLSKDRRGNYIGSNNLHY